MSSLWPAKPVGPRITELGKSTLPAGLADDQGAFPFYCSSPQVRRIDRAITTTSAILMGTGGVATVHHGQGAFSYSTDTWAFTVSDPWTDLAFLYRQLEHRLPQIDYAGFGGSGLRHLDKEYIRRLLLPVPNLKEQALIARMLSAIDSAIHETETIIVKLKAIKQGLLHDLLTRGIDANGELRPTQTEAPHLYKESPLGWIPKEWDVATLEAVSSTVTSGSRDWARFYADSGALFVRIGNLTREHINCRFDSTIHVRPPRNADGQRTRLESGDILISITADLGIAGVVPDGMGEAYINQHIALVRPSLSTVNPRFVGHYLASAAAQTYISKLNDAGAKAGLNLPTVRGLLTARPARTEQDLIAERLDEIDHRLQNAATESAKLRELKAGLMDDLLTGRVCVTPLLAAEPEGRA